MLMARPVAAPEPAPAAAALQEDAYLIGPGDQLDLVVAGVPEASGPVAVLSDGSAQLPLLGSVRLTGLTLGQANQWLSALYRRQLLSPQLLLRLVSPRPIRVAILGEVVRPGLYKVGGGGGIAAAGGAGGSGAGGGSGSGALPTLVDALQTAGGISLNADLRDVVLQRRLAGEPLRFKRLRLNLLELLQKGDQLQNPFLFDGDTISVARAAEPVAETMEVAATNLSPDQITVYLVGEVEKSGAVQLPANTPLIQALLAAGGLNNWRANRSKVELVRLNRNGTLLRERFQFNLSQGASNDRNPPLRDGDTVIVNRSGLAVANDALTAVGGPLTNLASILTLFRLAGNN